ncbi:hypothetical protein FSC37_03620 [Piscinibacter aquaticus]|uniref:Autotransporter outer membrane beta-barrel domain-containing protein n=1 Tax=Piscinibacter aquaticus TaxID=392597 RepID=A0A5C6U0Q9_9BURK|nr:hypothetical protein FSC37_03620 [Piscinibacter aquaticus]
MNSQGLRYADDPAGTSYTLVTRDPAQEQGLIGVGLRARALGGWSASLEMRSTLGGTARTGGVAASLQRSF